MSEKFSPFIPRAEYLKLLENYNTFTSGTIDNIKLLNDNHRYMNEVLEQNNIKISKLRRNIIGVSIFSIFQFSLIIFLYIIK